MERQKILLTLEAVNDAQEAIRILTGGCLSLAKLDALETALLIELEFKPEKKKKRGRPKKASR